MDSVRRLLVPAVVLVGMWSPPAPGQLSGRPPFGNISGRSGRAYVGGSPGAVSPYLISNEQALKILQANQGPIRAVAFSPNGKFLATAGNDNLIHVWGLASGSELRQLAGHQQAVTSVAFAPDGKTLASGSLDRTVRLWDLATGEEVRRFEGHQREIHQVAMAPDGKTLASASLDRTVRLWDLATGKERARAEGHQGEIFAVAFSPDGRTFASGSGDRTVRLWETATAHEVRRFEGHQDLVAAVAFSPDGKTLASAGHDQTIRLWDVGTGQETRRLTGSAGWVKTIAFSPDGRTLASGGQDQVLHLWEVLTGEQRRQIHGQAGMVWSVAFSPDARLLASGGEDQTARLWDATGLHRKMTLAAAPLTSQELEGFWADLAAPDAARADHALWALAEAGPQAVPFLREHLPRADTSNRISPQRRARLIADLDSDQFAVREHATDELMKLGKAAEPALQKVLESRHSAEVDLRVKLLLENLQAPALAPEELRALRAVEVLEKIDTPAARRLLQTLAEDGPDDFLKHEAQASWHRLVSRERE